MNDSTDPPKMTFAGKGCLILIFGLIFSAWLGFVLFFFAESRHYQASTEWPNTYGIVLTSEYKRVVSTSGTGRQRTTTTTYKPNITYQYSVSGENYENNMVQFMSSFKKESDAKTLVEGFPVDAEIPVFYFPDDPADSVLIQGLQDSTILVMNIFFFGGIAFVIILIFPLRKAFRGKHLDETEQGSPTE